MSVTSDTEWFQAAATGNEQLIRAYVSKYRHTRDINNETALMVATRTSALPVIRLLAEHEGKLVNNDGCTALMLAAMSDNGKLCAILVEYEADVVLSDGRDALILAAQIGNLEAMHELVKVCHLIQDCNQLTALDHSTNEGHLDCVRVLVHSYEITLDEINYCITIAEERHYTAILNYLQKIRDGGLADDPSFMDTLITNGTVTAYTTMDETSMREYGTGYYHDTMGGSTLTNGASSASGVSGVSKARLIKLIESLQDEIAVLKQQNTEQRNQLMKYIDKIPTTPVINEVSTRNSSICYPNRVLDEVKMNIAADDDFTSPSIDLTYRVNENPFAISRDVSQAPYEEQLAEKDEEIRRLRAINDDLRLTIQNANFTAYQSSQQADNRIDRQDADFPLRLALASQSLNGIALGIGATSIEEKHNSTANFSELHNLHTMDSKYSAGELADDSALVLGAISGGNGNHSMGPKSESSRKISFSAIQANTGVQDSSVGSFTVSPSIIVSKREERLFGPSSNNSILSGNANLSTDGGVPQAQMSQVRRGRLRPYSGNSSNAVFNTELSLKLTKVPPLLNNTFGDGKGDTPSSTTDLCPSRNSSIMGTPNQMSLSFLRGRKPMPQRTPRKSTDTGVCQEGHSVNFDSNRTSEIMDAPEIEMPDFHMEAASSTLGTRDDTGRRYMRRSESFQVGSRNSRDGRGNRYSRKPRIVSANPKYITRSQTPQSNAYMHPRGDISDICTYEDLDDSFAEYMRPSYNRILQGKDSEIKRLQDIAEELCRNLESAYHLLQLNQEAAMSFVYNTANNTQQGNAYSFIRVSQTSQHASVQQIKPAAPRDSEADGFVNNDFSASVRSAYSPYMHLMPDTIEKDGRESKSALCIDEPRSLASPSPISCIQSNELEEFASANGLGAYIPDLCNDFVEGGRFNLASALRELTKLRYAKTESPRRPSAYRSPSQHLGTGDDVCRSGPLAFNLPISHVPMLGANTASTSVPASDNRVSANPAPTAYFATPPRDIFIDRRTATAKDTITPLTTARSLDCDATSQYSQASARYLTPLMVAVSKRNVAGVVDNLKYAGTVNEFGETALMIAVDLSFVEGVKILVEKEAGIRTESGLTAIQMALQSNNLAIAKLLREKEGVPCDKLVKEPGRETDLMYAAEDNNLVNVYCFADVQVGLQDPCGRTALMYAAAASRFEAARLLYKLEYGKKGNNGETALMAAAYAGSGSIVRLLVSKEAGCMGHYEPEISEKHSALMIAAYNGHIACVRILAPSERHLRTESGLTALSFAENPKSSVLETTKHEVVSILQGCAK